MNFTTQGIIRVFLIFALWGYPKIVLSQDASQVVLETLRLPTAESGALDLPTLVQQLRQLPEAQRGDWIFEALQAGYLPGFLHQLREISSREGIHSLSFWVMPDYLALGEDQNFLHVSLSQRDAMSLAASWNMLLPTPKMVDLIYQQATVLLPAEPLAIDSIKDPIKLWLEHEDRLDHELQDLALESQLLQAGHFKDIVLSRHLLNRPHRAAIYGWQGTRGQSLQNLSTSVRDDYTDYSMGVRLVAPWCLLDGRWMKVADVLRDEKLAGLLSDEGAWDIDAVLKLDPLSPPAQPLPPSSLLVHNTKH